MKIPNKPITKSIGITVKPPEGFSVSGDTDIVPTEKTQHGYTEEELEVLLNKAREQWGVEGRFRKAQEECGELIVAISHFLSSRNKASSEDVASEVADVILMCKQLTIILGKNIVEDKIQEKINKFHKQLLTDKTNNLS
jgi:NTP pyrophosphatase (non-canonical NTP hydrolase)